MISKRDLVKSLMRNGVLTCIVLGKQIRKGRGYYGNYGHVDDEMWIS